MRTLALCLAVLVPTVVTAQTTGQVGYEDVAPFKTLPLDGTPAERDADPTMILLAAGIGFVAGFFLTLEEGVGKAVVQGAICGAITGGCTAIGCPCSTEIYTQASTAYGEGTLTEDVRERLAEAAHASGHSGVVLQRLTRARTGVGGTDAPLMLEVSVVDTETGQFWRLGDDDLGASSVLSVPIHGDIEAARADALRRLGIEM